MTEHDIEHILIATGSSQANGQVERINRILSPILAKLTNNDRKDYWYKILPKAEFSMNNTVSKSTGETPSRLLFGVLQRGKVSDAVANYLQDQNDDTTINLETIRSKASEKILVGQRQNEVQANKKRCKAPKYQPGDYVMIKNFDCTPGAPRKLIPKYKGPYVITKELRNDRYVISDIDGFQNTNKPYQGVWETNNMRPWLHKQT